MTQCPSDGWTTAVLADPHALVRAGLRMLLEHHGITVVGEASSAREAVRKVLGHKPSLLVADLGLPGGPLLDTLADVSDVSPGTRVVVVALEDPALARDALAGGAHAFLLKDASVEDLLTALAHVERGGGTSAPGSAPASRPWRPRGPACPTG